MMPIEQNNMQTFRSKIDWWVLGFIIAMTGLLLQLLVTMYAKGTMQEYTEHTAVYILTIAVLWWPILNTRYVVQEDTLIIHCLLFKWVIPVVSIEKITKTNHSISSPALSLNRLKIEYLKEGKSKYILVSPRNQQGFCQALQQKNSKIEATV